MPLGKRDFSSERKLGLQIGAKNQAAYRAKQDAAKAKVARNRSGRSEGPDAADALLAASDKMKKQKLNI